MTTTQAAELRVKWKQRADAPKCEHLNLELEWSEGGYTTGNYNCIVCGEAVATKRK
jgi:ssDNA-binding Zn-finger/Zn-ribbon topoisomerase 1